MVSPGKWGFEQLQSVGPELSDNPTLQEVNGITIESGIAGGQAMAIRLAADYVS